MTYREMIQAAAKTITLDQIEDGDMFDSVDEWLEYASDRDCENLAHAIKLAEDPPGYYDSNRERFEAMKARGDIH